MRQKWVTRMIRLTLLATSGATVLGTSCAYDVRKSIVKAGLDFVNGAADGVLSNVFPLDQILGNK
jgi:hypothetical protein